MSKQIKILCITNRHLCTQDYLAQVGQIARSCPQAVIVREKDLAEEEYEKLAGKVMKVCAQYQVPCILHTYVEAAVRLGAEAVHLPLPVLLSLAKEQKSCFLVRGASVHSPEEAVLAQAAGATYLTAGHVFATDCKRGVPPRGLSFLREVCAATKLPVYALGGIHAENAAACIQAGAQGVCIMSECMQRTDWSGGFTGWNV
ncbi:MAG: thiamine phosphate synthase [Eubacterium sp.]|nr:thiamine phosphate synthase [Eubacterium sp.]